MRVSFRRPPSLILQLHQLLSLPTGSCYDLDNAGRIPGRTTINRQAALADGFLRSARTPTHTSSTADSSPRRDRCRFTRGSMVLPHPPYSTSTSGPWHLRRCASPPRSHRKAC
ncbi:hypothetical protein C8R44DRAFT_796778 [Mycena epipterygia]|nr:hypothetical protein C8R44DRAFT_796778 [Mycena epipterygia]